MRSAKEYMGRWEMMVAGMHGGIIKRLMVHSAIIIYEMNLLL